MSGADNALVTPQVFSLPQVAEVRAQDKGQVTSQAMPVTVTKLAGELVWVKIEAQSGYTIPEILIPQAFSEWLRPPTQVGDKGWAVPADYYLGGQSGLGGGVANYRGRGNLTPLVFHPISQKAFPHNTNRDLNAAFINGPNGVVLQATQAPPQVYIKNDKIYIYPKPGTMVYLGGDGASGTYDFVETASGPSTNVKALTGGGPGPTPSAAGALFEQGALGGV